MPDFSDRDGLEDLRQEVFDHIVDDLVTDYNESHLVDNINDWTEDVLNEILEMDEDDYSDLAEAFPESFGYH